MAEEFTEWPSDEEIEFVNAGGDILDISDPLAEVIKRLAEAMRKELGLSEETTNWLANSALRGTANSVPSSVQRDIQHLLIDKEKKVT